jgi:DNA-directed RNA polymerase subunit RPC12/RpoP
MRNEIECLKCNHKIDISNIVWGIGHLKGMKTKRVDCPNCGTANNYSVNINGNLPEMFQGITGFQTLTRTETE